MREQYLSIEVLMKEGMFMCGSAETVAERLAAHQAEMGFANLVTMLQFGTLSKELTEKNLRIFAADVMPKLRALGVGEPAAAGAAAE